MKQEIDILSGAFSSQRLEKYINLYNGDVMKVAAHYKANIALSEALYTSLSVFEVTLRNALSKELERMMGRKDWYSVFPSNPALKSLTSEVTVAIRHISQRCEGDERDFRSSPYAHGQSASQTDVDIEPLSAFLIETIAFGEKKTGGRVPQYAQLHGVSVA